MGLKRAKGPGVILQEQNLDQAKSKRVTGNILVPGRVISDNVSSGGVLVGKGNLLRIRVSTTTYIAFGASGIAAVSSSTSPGLELYGTAEVPQTYLVNATDDYVRASAAVDRLEVVDE